MTTHIYYNIDIKGGLTDTFPLGFLANFEEERVQPLLDDPTEWYLTIARFQVPGSEIPIFQFPVQDERISTGPITVPGGVGPGRIVLTTTDTSNLLGSDLVNISGTPNIDGTNIQVIQVLSPTTFSIDIPVLSVGGVGTYEKVQDPLQSTLSVTLEHNGDVVRQFIRYSNSAPTVPLPQLVDGKFPKTSFYWVFSYERFIKMINDAFATAHSNLTAAPVGSLPPYVQYTNGSLSYVCQRAFYQSDLPVAGRIDIYINILMGTYFDPFNYEIFSVNSPLGKDLKLEVNDVPENYYNPPNLTPVVPPDYFRIDAEYDDLYLWNTFKDLVFISDSLPVNYEFTGANSQGLINFQPIVTDFQPTFEGAGESRSTLQYFPQGEYRLINMNSTIPLKRVSIQIFWKDQFDVLHPLTIREGQDASIKLLFIKKSVYSPEEVVGGRGPRRF